MWEVSLVLCENATVKEVRIDSHGPNNDGVDVCSSKYVLIENTSFDTGDDCIVLKSGRNDDGRRVNVPTENVVVRNVSMKDGHGAVTLGSELSAGIRNVFVENCTMDSPALWNVLRIKSNTMRGGTIENVCMKNVRVGQVRDAFLSIDFHYESAAGPYMPSVKNVNLSNIASQKSKYALYVNTDDLSPIRNLTIENCSFDNVNDGNFINGRFENLVLKNVSMNGKPLTLVM
jgi:polygalacturonase